MRILIIEDEPRAANQLERMLVECAFKYELLDTIDTVEDSVQWLKRNDEPDLIFMDIQLADGLSFEIFQFIEVETPIIFTTAFDQYAIQAFKVNSIDYLLKPIQKIDLESALSKFSKKNKSLKNDSLLLRKILSDLQSPQIREGILVREGSGFVQIKINQVLYFYSEDSITFGVTDQQRYIVDETMDELFATLNPSRFFKINRGQVVSRNSITKISPYLNHRVILKVINPRESQFIVSRTRTREFKEWMNR